MVNRDKDYMLNKQMELLQISNEQLQSIYDSITKIQQAQKQHADLIRELAVLLGLSETETTGVIAS